MKLLLIVLLFVLPLAAQDVTITIDITVSSEVVTAVNAWRLKQTSGDPPVLKYSSNLALLEAIISDGVLRILDQEPTASMAAEEATITVAKAAIQALKDAAVTIP